MTQAFVPTGISYLLPTFSVSGNSFSFTAGDYPDRVQVTNLDTANVAVFSIAATAAYPRPANNFIGTGVLIQPRTSVVIAVNQQAAANTAVLTGSSAAFLGRTANLVINSGTTEI
jgi:hypothetical protein